MMRLINKLSVIALTLSVTFLFSNPIFSEPANLALVKNELKNYHDSGLYQKELALVIQKAEKYIDQQAERNQRDAQHKKLGIVLDIDETSLSNYEFMVKQNFCSTGKQFNQHIIAADAPAIQPMLALYKNAIDHGVKVFFVTGRTESKRSATEKNLMQAGYSKWSGLYLRPDHYSAKSIVPFKAQTRKIITQEGYTILASIGDQDSDLKGGYAEKVFKLPNPFYYLP